jgi:hypothetical protein
MTLYVYRSGIHPDDWAWVWSKVFDKPDDGRPVILLKPNSTTAREFTARHLARRRNGATTPTQSPTPAQTPSPSTPRDTAAPPTPDTE